ncbi:Superfamily I DNA and RNA helicase and helicase subunit [Roseibacterium elongatum DSM 19469]|uniref:Superfamily I DNA and RNA helicase and helicase subunit n=1 Tax=Roseicyclus elongatus DSM 19469 TaxID=1294273 RepID=W8S687_9RHOB|nr:TM0106 family RecB-like putative nuclease [Roseibacterium elongatum]AHM05757.1 Superfamily I DNA and RNA helicase and helicase subunit [Roseibacterium elongatum DSM 19469]
MRFQNGDIRLSASDLMRFTSCAHATRLDLEQLHGRGPEHVEDSEDAALLQKQGDAHEAEHLAKLKFTETVIEIDKDQPFDAAVKATQAALLEGPDIVFQGALEGDAWGGWSDFLERVDVPSDLGPWSYEVADTKLKRKPDPKHLLQLVLYSDLLTPLQGRASERAHVILGNGERATFRLAEYAAYARNARDRLEAFVAEPWETRPVPVSACALCRWREHCGSIWTAEDSLWRIAGISAPQVAKLESAGVTTMRGLAEHDGPVAKLAEPTLEKLRLQARLQTDRDAKGPHHVLRPPVEGKGFDLLWRPDPGDLFYDIEGDPHYAENGIDGLEYLHGIWDGADFTAIWAHDHAEERNALVRLFEIFDQRLTAHPGAHIYHYAAYEITALRRLCTHYGVGEAKLDKWLREKRFCDLFAVVRGGIAASEKSYSIKDMEALYGFERTGEVTTAGGSVVAYENWRENGDPTILAEIEDYNRLDCISTEELRDWLVSVRPDGPWPDPAPEQDAHHDLVDHTAEALREQLLAADLPEGRGQLLFDLAQFHTREKKPAAWTVFDAATKTSDELCEDPDCLGGLNAVSPQSAEGSAVVRRYRFPVQESKLKGKPNANVLLGEQIASVSIKKWDPRARTVDLKLSGKYETDLPGRLDLIPTFALNTDAIEAAIMAVVADQLGSRANKAADDLLAHRPPRMQAGLNLASLASEEPVTALIRACNALDNSVLPVQGPPGTGKTYVTARAILSLVASGKRVGVASNAHEAIRNVLMGCIDALDDETSDFSVENLEIAHKGKQGDTSLTAPYDRIRIARNNTDRSLSSADVVGGTAWLFSRPEMKDAFDYLFVDEAGQVSLANLVAMTNTARNIVLIGDPNQLPQVIQGAHPTPADKSCLEWIIGEEETIPEDRGLFLSSTRRMHPDLCSYISSQFYEDRLHAHPSTTGQRVLAQGLPSTGAHLVPVDHAGRSQVSPEEINAIASTVRNLLGGQWTDKDGHTRALQAADIIVVAPYNLQVDALSEASPEIRVGTVDRFQGQEAPVAIVSMTASSADETPRGLDFLLSRQRMNVAISRGKALSLVFASPRLLETKCTTVDQMRLVNALCALPIWTGEETA